MPSERASPSRRPSARRHSPCRAAILAALHARGPLRFRALLAQLPVTRKSALHHVRVLARDERVRLAKVRGALIVALPDQRAEDAAPRCAAARAQERVVDAVRRNGGAIERRALDDIMLGVPARTRRHAIRALAARGEIVRELGVEGEILRITRR